MPEQGTETATIQRFAEHREGNEPGITERPDRRRQATLRWMVRAGVVGAGIAVAVNVWFYYQSGAWQMLAGAAAQGLAMACFVLGAWLARRGKLDAAGCLTLLALIIALGSGELLDAGLTLYLGVGGTLLILAVGLLVLPRRWYVWLPLAVLFAGYVWLINWLQPLPRCDMGTLDLAVQVFGLILIIFLAFVVLWQIFQAYERFTAIRVRLPISFVLVVLLPVVIFTVVLLLVGSRTGQQQAFDKLELVATVKESGVAEWIAGLGRGLDEALSDRYTMLYARMVLESDLRLSSPGLYLSLEERFSEFNDRTQLFDSLFLLNLEGQPVVATDDAQESANHADQPYFQEGLKGTYVQPAYYSQELGRSVVVAARPVADDYGQITGVLAGYANPSLLNDVLLDRTGLGETGDAYLLDSQGMLLTPARFADVGAPVSMPGAKAAMQDQPDGADVYGTSLGEPMLGVYRWLPALGVALLAEQAQTEALASTFAVLEVVVIATFGALVVAVAIALLITRGIVRPLAQLTGTTTQIAAGDLTLVAPVEQKDEIGVLAQAFNSMTAQMRELIGSLEQRVTERTDELERRSAFLEAGTEVGRAASSILDPEALVREAVELIRERFGLYYVGLFLLDETGDWAVLQAGTGEAGRTMLSRKHRIRIGQGMVGWVVANAQWRVSSEVGQDALRLATPELPHTLSEAALPLRSRGQVIGALTVQDTHPNTFDEETMIVLQTMADQIAVALDNAHLFVESQEALQSERRAYGEISREAWAQMIPTGMALGYRCDQRGVSRTENSLPSEVKQSVREGQVVRVDEGGRPAVAVPISVRDQVIGVLNFRKAGRGETWIDAEISLLQGLAEQLGQALESARLYQDVQRRAARDRMFSEATTRMRETLDMDAILQTAIREIGESLGLAEVEVRMRKGSAQESMAPAAQAGDDGREATEEVAS